MTLQIIVPVLNRSLTISNEKSIKIFNMELPTHIHLFLQNSLVEKMKQMKVILTNNNFSKITILSSHRMDSSHSHAVLYRNNKLLKVSYYEDFDKLWETVDLTCFELFLDSLSNQFKARFIYGTGYGEETLIYTTFFSID